MDDEVVNDCLIALKFAPDWLVTSKMLETFHDCLLANYDMLVLDKKFCKFTFYANQMGILGVYLDKINLDDDFYEDDPDTIIHVRLSACRNKFEKRKALKNISMKN